ncbi:MAG: ATP-dependent Clp protease proteolytic subunit [Sphaerochaetaceae bacterium]|jgi:ATP-dependent Clp protease protease subunit|nr:ATP-dependent Clp protease proteolytic subunit [Sphaerochaetaceae bacterium]NLO60125.1 ATP-dependent Clp protease proteolytic subunit [Spirochaetales bacterium]MDD2406094.1 ATP-dependent Clp protease proteolytic subunit [Sphaerochaetaceae bacterium]MDD3670078.1 ATP-dependent Clp protease proteolytic subunit [Sphaerochaetaceae bacterium]MDD4260246.1 ATP-dependent Clp protease proteolytic subunit [Sphaerochaetaceae bacterium]
MAETEQKNAQSEIMTDKLLKTRSIMLSGGIDKESAEKVIKQLLILDAEGETPIKIFINSPGGDVEAGLAIFDMVRFVTCEVIMIGMGLVASAAALILLAVDKDKRLGLPNSSYLIHQPMSKMEGVATDIEIYTKQLEKLRNRLNQIISEQTGKPIEVVAKDTDRDYWLDAKDALSYGLINKIVSHQSEL